MQKNLSQIQEKIEKIRINSSLGAISLEIMGVTKGQPASKVEEAIRLGLTLFGENRVQEASEKWVEIRKKHPNIHLHLIGPLQTNKIKQALSLFDVIQTLDRPKLAEEIAKHTLQQTKAFYIQVNTGEEPQKAGVFPGEADNFIRYCLEDLKLPVTGLMCIPPANELPAPHFALLRTIAGRHNLKNLSMGMSGDYETAIRMGATCIRIGTALFGERDQP